MYLTLPKAFIYTKIAIEEYSLGHKLSWEEKITKYTYGIDLSKALKEELDEYINMKLYAYEQEGLVDSNLWITVHKEFNR